jgi:putative DNA primase/helicase
MSLAKLYLTARGLDLDTAKGYGVEWDNKIDRDKIVQRLGADIALNGHGPLSKSGVEELLWFRVTDKFGNILIWICRPFPTLDSKRKFLCPLGSNGPPFIPSSVYASKESQPLIITEGPVKTLVLAVSGSMNAIGLNGVWGAASRQDEDEYGEDKLTLRPELEFLHLLGRRVYLAFDADQFANTKVRHALIRLYLLLAAKGADVYQLTTWPMGENTKGIDDYLVSKGIELIPKTCKDLIATARPFHETLARDSLLDAHLVQRELPRVYLEPIVAGQLIKRLARALDVKTETLRGVAEGPVKSKPELSFSATYEPWPDPADAEELFNEIMVRIGKEVIIEPYQLWVCALWVMFTWVHPQMEFSPILYITGPTYECGKTTLLNVIGKMVIRPAKTANVSPPALYRLSELYHPTCLMDEAQDHLKNPDFWLVIKSGHTPGEYAIRCNPNTNEPEVFDVFCPKLLAGIGKANPQIMSRSIIIEMERKDGELDRSLRESDPVFVEIRRKLTRWASDVGTLSQFKLPKLSNSRMRHRDNWETLYRVAKGVSEAVAQQLVSFIPSFIDEEQDYNTYLLDSLRKLYREHDQLTEEGFMGSEAIVEALNQDKEAPWYAKNDKGLTRETLARHLKRYKVKPDKVWQEEIKKQLRGYRYTDSRPCHNDLKRIFEQYLPPENEK